MSISLFTNRTETLATQAIIFRIDARYGCISLFIMPYMKMRTRRRVHRAFNPISARGLCHADEA